MSESESVNEPKQNNEQSNGLEQGSKEDYDKVFCRQVKIQGWKQDKLKQQVALVLGAGGIGSIVLMNLLRTGIKKIFIVDYDMVEIHNINRQLMYTNVDVGQKKIDASLKNSVYFNVGGTEIHGESFDATKEWDKIVEWAKQSTVVFNCIDHGDYWDAAVQSLCISLNLPHIIAGTFAQSFMAEIYLNQPCYACLDDMLKPEFLTQITPDKIQLLKSVDFLPKNSKPEGQSHVALCSTAGNFATQHFLNYVNEEDGCKQTKKVLFYMTTFESVQFPLEANPKCYLCGNANQTPKASENQEAEKNEQTQDQQNETQ